MRAGRQAMKSPEATIGICFRNPGAYFRLALQSVFAQTFEDWELILLNDISKDGSLELAQGIRDDRVRVFDDGLGKGLNVRLNQMVRLARGRYFFRMDADDAMHPERVAEQVRLLRRHDDSTVVGSAMYSMDSQSRVVGIRGVQSRQQAGFRARRSFHHPTVAASTEWFREHPYAEADIFRRAEDAELWCRTTGVSRFVVMPEPWMFYREGSSSFTAYMKQQLVLLYILRERFRRPTARYLIDLSKLFGKLWVGSVFEALGNLDAM